MRALPVLMLIVVAAWGAAAAAAEVADRLHGPRGEFVDIGRRRLRLVCEGPRSDAPTVWLEAGAFGGAADFAAIQQKLTGRGLRSCAYDRAGMGYSDPGPGPRDGAAIAGDLAKLIAASGERGPFVFAGHSMAGLYLRLYTARHPDQVAGLVLIDAAMPEMIDAPGAQQFVDRFTTLARLGAAVGSLGLTKPFYLMGDRIGLPPEGRAEKRHGFVSGRQSRTALAEVESWRAAAQQAAAAGPLDPDWPVAVVMAGPAQSGAWTESREAPAQASRAGFVDHVEGAGHRTLLGLVHGDRTAAAIQRVVAGPGARD
ncbi:alpha/beta fold hydrolase [Phenylobacterium sp. J367]|uniref:alpha/beta fold hydrolase n=1 Tax=Phenylobacterium sp. J367 TaxID=2898435 RepID=UPI002150AC87|nr:alpha/beta hydrolase [Phenylobacterium sp. J367]MCR5878501.1 alpha/beta hydrolase [Phenylobacterium sp. J367]